MVSRRGFLARTAAFSATAFVMGTTALTPAAKAAGMKLIGFRAIPASGADTVTVPEGYSWQTLISWGDPLFSQGKPFDQATRGTGESQELAFGDNNDGMSLFALPDGRFVMAVNNEYDNQEWLFPTDSKDRTADDVRKSKAAQGVSIFEVRQDGGAWQVVIDGALNRRITADTPMAITGPAAGHALLKTPADPEGRLALGTWNNCGNGRTPWGTYLTCEENFNGYFATDAEYVLTDAQKRYGIKTRDRGVQWYQYDDRFDLSKSPNEANRFGYIVEIDPMNPDSTPKKRTALGRFKHENAEVTIAADGRVVVYSGDDERGEHLYRFVSKNRYVPGNDAANASLLEDGTLYVAKFGYVGTDMSGRGEWIELTHGRNGLTAENGFSSQAEVLIHTRMAATTVGATTMDRPEWVAVHPTQAEAYCALTNNSARGVKKNSGGVEQPVGGPNPREKNGYGQIVRWRPDGQDHGANAFSWDLFVMAGNPEVHPGTHNAGSANINAANMFNSPDGLAFDGDGRLWIQTDGNYQDKDDFAGMGNNQMLCGDPATGEIRRFLTGPIACEITGISFTPDQKTMFVGVQHPGAKKAPSHFPGGGDTVPRSSVVAVTRKDGGVIGG
ncbi:MAG: PhoX family phosphatase [Alphaproteobacteria bacterium]